MLVWRASTSWSVHPSSRRSALSAWARAVDSGVNTPPNVVQGACA
jgi:hypothetical protein